MLKKSLNPYLIILNKQPGSARNVRKRMMNHLITVGSAMKKMNNLI